MKLQTVKPSVFPNRSTYRSASGRQCRLAIFDPQSGLCANHHADQKQNERADVADILFGMPKTSKLLRASTIHCAASMGSPARTASLLVAPRSSPKSAVCFCAHCPPLPKRGALESPTSLIHPSPTQPRNRHDKRIPTDDESYL